MFNLEELAKVRCRFGCPNPIGIFHVPEGCICWEDPVHALCEQHFITAESTGEIVCLVDLTITPPDPTTTQRLENERDNAVALANSFSGGIYDPGCMGFARRGDADNYSMVLWARLLTPRYRRSK